MGIFFIILASYGFVCRFETLIAIRAVNNVEMIIIYSLTIRSLLIDIVGNWELVLKCNWIQYIFYGDPYWFRVQIILFLPFMIYTLIVEIWQFFTSSEYIDVVKNHNATLATNTVTYTILLIIDVILPLTITIIETIFWRIKKKQSKLINVNYTMTDKLLEPLFASYCASEFSIENFAAFQEIQKFKKSVTMEHAQIIHKKFFNGAESIMEVNCPRKPCLEVAKKISENDVTSTLFDVVEKDTVLNLCDTLMRFVSSRGYIDHMKSMQTTIELIEGKKTIGLDTSK
jgi:hypothetical protein